MNGEMRSGCMWTWRMTCPRGPCVIIFDFKISSTIETIKTFTAPVGDQV